MLNLYSEKAETEFRGDSVIFRHMNDREISRVPSSLYPLKGKMFYFDEENTTAFPDGPETDKIRSVFNSFPTSMRDRRTAFERTGCLQELFQKAGIDAPTYCGWFIGGTKLLHASCILVFENHIIDPFPDICKDSEAVYDTKPTIEDLPQTLPRLIKYIDEAPHSDTMVFGQCPKNWQYIVSPCDPKEWETIVRATVDEHPEHPLRTRYDAVRNNPVSKAMDSMG